MPETRKFLTVQIEWEHALVVQQTLDIGINEEKKRLSRMKSPRWKTKTERKIAAGEHVREKISDAVMARLGLNQ